MPGMGFQFQTSVGSALLRLCTTLEHHHMLLLESDLGNHHSFKTNIQFIVKFRFNRNLRRSLILRLIPGITRNYVRALTFHERYDVDILSAINIAVRRIAPYPLSLV